MHITEAIRQYLGWCPDHPVPFTRQLVHTERIETPGTVVPDGAGGPRDSGRFRVPRDMLGMLTDPIGTIQKSKYVPLSGILFWYGALAVISALVLGATTGYLLEGTDFEHTGGMSAFTFSMNLVSGEIAAYVLITGLTVAIVHGISRLLDRNSTLPMALRVVLYGATPVFLFCWTFFPGPTVIHALTGTNLPDAAMLVLYANLLFLIWTVVLIGIGFRELHRMTEVNTESPEVIP